MTLLRPPVAPRLGAALEAVGRRDPGAGEALAAAVAADEDVLVPTSDDGRHPLATGAPGAEHMSAFTSPWLALWAHPSRPPVDAFPVTQVLGWVGATGRLVRLDHASEVDTCLGPDEADALLAGRPVDPDAVAAGDQFRNPEPPAAPPDGVLDPPVATQAAGAVSFAHRWDAVGRQPIDPVDVSMLEGVGAGYTAVRRRSDGVDVVQWGETVVVGTSYGGGEVKRWEWARFAEGLFLTELGVAVDDGSARPRPRLVVLARPDGLVRTWTARPDGSDLVTATVPDTRERWIGLPPLGTFEPLVDP